MKVKTKDIRIHLKCSSCEYESYLSVGEWAKDLGGDLPELVTQEFAEEVLVSHILECYHKLPIRRHRCKDGSIGESKFVRITLPKEMRKEQQTEGEE
jgi:hypothetical protein